MPGPFVVGDRIPIGQAIQEILVLDNWSDEGEWEGIVLFLPL